MLRGTNITGGILDDPFANIDVNVVEHAIGGKMVTAQIVVSENDLLEWPDRVRQQVRRTLVTILVEHIFDNQLCEITQMKDPAFGSHRISSRVFLTKNDHIRILRTYKTSIK
jgi:hypothetical protein